MRKFSKQRLEQYVPALRSASSEVSERVRSFFDTALRELKEYTHTEVEDIDGFYLNREETTHLECLYTIAARMAVASLDLVATATGFGVVSNQNVAPASAHRVEALREDLRTRSSLLKDTILLALTDEGMVGFPRISNLIYCPALARLFGIMAADGRPVYEEEYQALLPRIIEAEEKVAQVISPELFEAFVEEVSTHKPRGGAYRQGILIASWEVGRLVQGLRTDFSRLRSFIEENADELLEYRNSSTYRGYHAKRYEDKETDTAYFFA